jgi:hypothetical protein
MQYVVPALKLRSHEASQVFYDKLGFEEQWNHRFETGHPVFASISCDGMEIFLTEHTGDCQFGGLVHFYVANVDQCDSRFRQRGVTVKEPPSNSHGQDIRDMLVMDPDGNRLSLLSRAPCWCERCRKSV